MRWLALGLVAIAAALGAGLWHLADTQASHPRPVPHVDTTKWKKIK